MSAKLSAAEMGKQLRKCMDSVLTKRESEIITMRYGIDGTSPQTQRAIAVHCGISRSYVSRIEKRALKKLEQAMQV